jgi:hypothetical protein
MEENNSFKSKALSHIPLDIQAKMLNATKVETDGMGSILDAISKLTPNSSPLPIAPASAPQQEQFLSLAVDGNVIKVPADATKGAVVMFMYILAVELSKNKRIAKILKQFNFTMFDANNVQIYPPKKKGKK